MMATSAYVFDVDATTFDAAVIERSKQVPVVLDFWAPWCGPCRTLTPILERLVNARNGGVVLAKINVDENPELASAFRIEGIPAIKAIKDGRLVMQFEGLLPEAQLAEFLDRLLPSETDTEAKRAADLEATKPAEAAVIYSKLLSQNPAHVPSLLGLARVRLANGDFDEAQWLLDKVPPGGDEGAEADRIRSLLAMRKLGGDEAELRRRVEADPENAPARLELGRALAAQARYPEALEALYSAAERDRELARGPVKELMVQIFQIIGQRSDLAEEYRDKLRRVMY
jgi:putative thioredoxin